MEEIKKCARCGKRMTDSHGTSVIGIDITVNFESQDEELKDFAKKQLGKYILGRRYSFCYECWLDSLFGN